MKAFTQTSKPLLLLAGFLLVAQFVNGINAARMSNSETANIWYSLAFYWAMGWWFINDSRKHDSGWADEYMDIGMFLYIGWVFIIPYYLFKTRRWKALYTIGLLLSVYFGFYFAGALLYFFISAF